MLETRSVFAVLFLWSFAAASAASEPSPCRSDPGYAALDFWVGEWDVFAEGRRDGYNRIEKILDGCAIVENWSDADGSEGKSLFFYNPVTKTWKQVWIPEVGALKEKTQVEDPAPGAVRFQGEVALRPDLKILDRTTLVRLPGGRVQQVIEISRDEGRTWRTGFDAVYVPVEEEAPRTAPRHEPSFWDGIVKDGYRVPAGESADGLLLELAGRLGSSDPKLRDDYAYGIAAAWIYGERRVSDLTLRELQDRLTVNLQVGLGARGSATLFLRSFSALDLSLLAAADLRQPFFDEARFEGLLSAALGYLQGEKDLRAFDARSGWMHATAHTADLLKFLGRNPRLRPAQQGPIFDAVAAKLVAAGEVFAHGENERLAAVVEALVVRPDLDSASFDRFLVTLAGPGEHLWDAGSLVDPVRYAAAQNAKDLLRSLYVGLCRVSPGTPRVESVREAILLALGRLAS